MTFAKSNLNYIELMDHGKYSNLLFVHIKILYELENKLDTLTDINQIKMYKKCIAKLTERINEIEQIF